MSIPSSIDPAEPRDTDDHGRTVTHDDVVALIGDFLDDLSRQAHQRLGEVAGVAVTMVTAGGLYSVGASTDAIRAIDRLQYDIGSGPCLEAFRDDTTIHAPDLAVDPRWTEFGPQAAEQGFVSCLSIPIHHRAHVIAVAKIYRPETAGITAQQRETAEQFATECAGGIGLAWTLSHTSNELADRTEAMNHRRTIDLAIGIMMGQSGCTSAAAFTMLRQASQRSNRKLRDVAAQLVNRSDPAPFTARQPTPATATSRSATNGHH